MLHFLYSQIFRIALPLLLLKNWLRERRSPLPSSRSGWLERLGIIESSKQEVIWVHAVSVGETIAAAPLVEELLRRRPGQPVLMTAMTRTGSERARALFRDRVAYAYSPYDTPGAARRFVERVRPRVLVIMETELWPNMISACQSRNVPVFLVNARLSERSAQGYERVRSLATPLIRSLSWIGAQARDDAERFCRLGAASEHVSVTGSVKYDVEVSPAQSEAAQRLRDQTGRRPVWIAASTHEGEDEQLLAAHRDIQARCPSALMILVPRHPERFDAVATLIRSQGFSVVRRSGGEVIGDADVYLADTMGELMMLYGAADVAFVAGSLITRGGHNPLEPAAWARPVVSGPHVFNFDAIYQRLRENDAVAFAENASDLASTVTDLLTDSRRRDEMGQRARQVVDDNRGALDRVVGAIEARLG